MKRNLLAAMPALALLFGISAAASSTGCTVTQAAPNGSALGTDGGGGGTACAAGHALSCGEVLRCDAACADNDNACYASCEGRVSSASKPTFDAANTCVMNSTCATTDCAIAACKDTLDACKADDTCPAGTTPGGNPPADGGTTPASTCLPECLAQLKTKCPPLVGACTVETNAGVESRYCYDDGTKMRVPLNGTPASFVGCPARTYDTQFNGSSITYNDASGNHVERSACRA